MQFMGFRLNRRGHTESCSVFLYNFGHAIFGYDRCFIRGMRHLESCNCVSLRLSKDNFDILVEMGNAPYQRLGDGIAMYLIVTERKPITTKANVKKGKDKVDFISSEASMRIWNITMAFNFRCISQFETKAWFTKLLYFNE